MIRRPPRSTRVRSSAASDVYKRQALSAHLRHAAAHAARADAGPDAAAATRLSLIHISEPTRLLSISYAVFCLKKKKKKKNKKKKNITNKKTNNKKKKKKKQK